MPKSSIKLEMILLYQNPNYSVISKQPVIAKPNLGPRAYRSFTAYLHATLALHSRAAPFLLRCFYCPRICSSRSISRSLHPLPPNKAPSVYTRPQIPAGNLCPSGPPVGCGAHCGRSFDFVLGVYLPLRMTTPGTAKSIWQD